MMDNRSKLVYNSNNTMDNTRDLLDSNEYFSPGLLMMMEDGRLSRRGKAVYGKKQSEALKAPPRRYELVVFNVTRDHDVDSVKSYITSDGVDVLNIKTLPTNSEFNDCLMFKVDVHYKDRETVLDSDFWPENVGCREFYKRSKFENRVVDQLNRNE